MPIARSIRTYLEKHGVKYDVITHNHTLSSMKTAQAASIPGDQLAKTVILKDGEGYLMAVLPSTHHLDIDLLNSLLYRDLELVDETELESLFLDCEPGALPPVGPAYDMQAIMDSFLSGLADVYFEAGDHRELIHVSGKAFRLLQEKSGRGRIGYHI
ncbi:MAG: aminoacyl-tRNA deacylase [Mariprofundaceae bacterium]